MKTVHLLQRSLTKSIAFACFLIVFFTACGPSPARETAKIIHGYMTRFDIPKAAKATKEKESGYTDLPTSVACGKTTYTCKGSEKCTIKLFQENAEPLLPSSTHTLKLVFQGSLDGGNVHSSLSRPEAGSIDCIVKIKYTVDSVGVFFTGTGEVTDCTDFNCTLNGRDPISCNDLKEALKTERCN